MNDLIIWHGAVAGVAIGFYVFVQLWVTGRPLGASTGYGYLCILYSKDKYFCINRDYAPQNIWRLWFLIGILLGGIIAAVTSPDFEYTFSSSMGAYYDKALPDNLYLKLEVLFIAGIFVGFGARMANGCTSAHAIYGIGCLSLHSFILSVLFFVSATATGQLLFK